MNENEKIVKYSSRIIQFAGTLMSMYITIENSEMARELLFDSKSCPIYCCVLSLLRGRTEVRIIYDSVSIIVIQPIS